MYYYEQAGSSSSSCIANLHHFVMRRHRNLTIAVISLVVLSAIWLYSSDVVGNFPSHTFRFSTINDDTNGSGPLIPRKIWQIQLPKQHSNDRAEIDADALQDTATWLAMNAGYAYTLVGDSEGKDFVSDHFANDLQIVQTYDNLPNVGMKSDFLRYLMLGIEGGVYTDTDTIALKPIDLWIPEEIRDQVRLIVGIEFDRRDGGAWADIPHWLQFCQWTIAAAPGHPVFRKMVNRIFQSLDELSQKYGVSVDQLHPTSFEVMNSTGPAAWTDVVFEQLQEYDPSLQTTKDLSFMTEPKLYGDILVLTIDGFGVGQVHSHSTNDGTIPEAALMRHLFRGSWREPSKEESEQE